MTHVNIRETNNNVSKLIRMPEDASEGNIISGNAVPIIHMAGITGPKKKTIIGATKNDFKCPDNIHLYDDEISELFEAGR